MDLGNEGCGHDCAVYLIVKRDVAAYQVLWSCAMP